MSTLITILHVIVCLFLMLTVLLQSGKSGGMGAAFGGGNAATVFGGSGASTFLRKLTTVASVMFMATSIVLAFLASHNSADALEKFGESEQKKAAEKEALRAKALTPGSGSGSAAGSASGSAAGSGASLTPVTTPDPNVPNIPAAGSAGAVGTGNAGGGVTGNAPTPAEMPVPASSDPAVKPNPSTPAGMGPAPTGTTPKPVDTAKPTNTGVPVGAGSAAKPADAPKPSDKPATGGTTVPDAKPPAASNDGKPTAGSPAPASSSPNAPK